MAVEQVRSTEARKRLTPSPALTGVRVVDLSTWIAGAYCTKLLADGGAEVIKVEPPSGDPLRRWAASGASIAPDEDGALFNFLDASKEHVVIDPTDDDDLASLHDVLASADAVVWPKGSDVAEHASLAPRAILGSHPHITVAAITPFGLEGPWRDKPATEFTLQAWSGGVIGLARGTTDRAPVCVGGQVGEWLAGVFAAIGTLASRRRTGPDGELVDVSMLEALAMCLTYYPVTYHDQLGRPMRKRRFVPTPGVAAARDGLVGLGVGTGQQWLDFCAMVGHPGGPRIRPCSSNAPPLLRRSTRGSQSTASKTCSILRPLFASRTHPSRTAPTSRRSSTSALASRSSPTRETERPTPDRRSDSVTRRRRNRWWRHSVPRLQHSRSRAYESST